MIHVVQGEPPSSEQKTHTCFAALKMEVACVSEALLYMHLADNIIIIIITTTILSVTRNMMPQKITYIM
jgi:hypothetical protein